MTRRVFADFTELLGPRVQVGHWTVLGDTQNMGKSNHLHFLCRCECGTERWVNGHSLQGGVSRSCGCQHPGNRNARNGLWKGDAAGDGPIHLWLIRHYPKSGTCELCKRHLDATGSAGTHYAYLRHPEFYTRNRADYIELCPRCHNRFDVACRRAQQVAEHGGHK